MPLRKHFRRYSCNAGRANDSSCHRYLPMLYLTGIIESKRYADAILKSPLVYRKRVMPMNTMEVLTLLLVVFAALTYIDNRHNKK